MIKWLKSMFNDPMGETSSKRVMAVTLIVNGIVQTWMGNQLGVAVIGTGTALLIANGVTKT